MLTVFVVYVGWLFFRAGDFATMAKLIGKLENLVWYPAQTQTFPAVMGYSVITFSAETLKKSALDSVTPHWLWLLRALVAGD